MLNPIEVLINANKQIACDSLIRVEAKLTLWRAAKYLALWRVRNNENTANYLEMVNRAIEESNYTADWQ